MKKTVFISSTYEDLVEYRKAIWELLEKYDVNIKGMEAFGARKETPLDTCLNEVSQSDIYVGIIGQRLGSIDTVSGKSYTQLEYEHAVKEKKEILIYFINEKEAKILIANIDFDDKRKKLENFKTILKDKHTIDTFKDEADLKDKLERRLDDILKINEKTSTDIEGYELSKNIIQKFLVLPKVYSDKEIKIKIQFTGQAFPVSKDLCQTFGYTYGRTMAVPIKVVKPELTVNKFTEILIEEELADVYFNASENEIFEVIVKILFSTTKMDSIKANLFDSSTILRTLNPSFDPTKPATDYYNIYAFTNPRYFEETKYIQGEGTAILFLREILVKEKVLPRKKSSKKPSSKSNVPKKSP